MRKHQPVKIINENAMRGRNFVVQKYFDLLRITYYARRKGKNARNMFFPVGEIDSSRKVNRCKFINGCLAACLTHNTT